MCLPFSYGFIQPEVLTVFLNAVPADLVGIQVQLKGAVVGVNGGVLGNLGVVDHAVLAVGNEGMDFHIVVGGEPLVEDCFTVSSPQDGTVQNTAVLKGVGQAGGLADTDDATAVVDELTNCGGDDGIFPLSAAVKRYIDLHFKEPLTLEQLAEDAHINKYYLSHSFKRAYSTSPINYRITKRIEESKYLLAETDRSMTQSAQLLEFSSLSYFSQVFRRTQETTPMDYRHSAKNT